MTRYLLPNARNWAPRLPEGEEEATEQPLDELANFLLSSLQMQHLLVLAGSGTSLQVGGPTMDALWTACVDDAAAPDAHSVLEKLKYGGDGTERNIEELLSRCDAHLQVNNDDTVVAKFREFAISKILKVCRAIGSHPSHDMRPHKEFLRRLARRRARDPRLKVFTTNYDLCFEHAAGELGLVALDGFSFSQPRRFDPIFFDFDVVRRNPASTDGPNYVPGVFQYFKLHGSVDWGQDSRGGVSIDQHVGADRACLVYPTQQKYRFSFQQPHLELVAQFLASLRQANSCLLVIGFGFNDDHLSEPIFAALESNPHLRVVIVSPNGEKRFEEAKSNNWKRVKSLFSRGSDVGIIAASFEEFVSLVPDLRALTPGERLQRAVMNVVEN